MKYLKISGIFLLVVIAIVVLLSMFIPVQQTVERSIIIKAPPITVYEQLIKLENFNKWAVWNLRDSLAKHSMTGTDGTVGATTSWRGDPEISGEGKIIIASLVPGKRIVHTIHFLQPRKADARSEFKLEEVNGGTRLTWEFDLATPRPKNIFNLFYSMDKKMGKDFEEGLLLMKTALEINNPSAVVKKYDVLLMNFPATRFAWVRQQVKQDDILSFFAQHFPLITQEIEKVNAPAGIPHGLFYSWDEKYEVADMAAAIPVPAGTSIENAIVQVMDIPASKAVYVDYYGNYPGLPDVHSIIQKYLSVNNLKQKGPVIESYVSGPPNEKDTAKWETRVIYLVE
jgi:effector-binding domain-containing protein/uncharacterized protein YndB with AHSA1/START domain